MSSAGLLNLLRCGHSAAARRTAASLQVLFSVSVATRLFRHKTKLLAAAFNLLSLNLWPAGGRGFSRGGACATGQRVEPTQRRLQRPDTQLGLIWYLGQQDRGTSSAAVQYQTWKTHPTGEGAAGRD